MKSENIIAKMILGPGGPAMNFEHTEDRRMLSDMLRRFVAEQYDIATRHANAGASAP